MHDGPQSSQEPVLQLLILLSCRAIQLDVEAAAKMTGKEGVAALCRLYQTHVLTKASQAQVMSLPSSGEEVCLYPNDVAAASHVTRWGNLKGRLTKMESVSLAGQSKAGGIHPLQRVCNVSRILLAHRHASCK